MSSPEIDSIGPLLKCTESCNQVDVGSDMMAMVGAMGRLAAAIVTVAAPSGCLGGAGEPCKSDSILGPSYCDNGLTCDADSNTCQQPKSRHEGESCSAQDLCASELWCDVAAKKCLPFLREGDACSNPVSCGPNLTCVKAMQATICGQTPDGDVTATVIGTLTLPGGSQAKGNVDLFTTLPRGGTPVTSSAGTPVTGTAIMANGTNSLDYRIVGVSAGTYFLLGFVDVDGSGGGSSTPGDYAGWYGQDGDGNPPATANVVVPATGTVRFDLNLVQR